MGPPQESSLPHLGKRKRLSAGGGGSSSSALQENGELVSDTQTLKDPGKDATSEIYSVLEEPPPQQEALIGAPLVAEGRPPTGATLEAEGRPPTGADQWYFNIDILPPLSVDLRIMECLPSEEPAMPRAMFRGLEKCIKRHRHMDNMVD